MPIFSAVISLLTDLTKKEVQDLVQWTELCNQAFAQVKAVSLDFFLPFVLQTDIELDREFGAILAQVVEWEEITSPTRGGVGCRPDSSKA